MNILIISPERYQNFYTSKIQIANYLKRKHKVFFLNPYISIKEKKFFDENVHGIHLINLMSLNFISKFKDPTNHYINMINRRVLKIDLIWSFDTKRVDILEKLVSKTKIFHVTDEFKCKKSIKTINNSVDCILSVSKKLKRGFDTNKTFVVGHFIMENFLNFKPKSKKKYKNIVAITGNFHMKEFNAKLLKKLVEQNKKVTFYLIGPILKNHFKYILKLNKDRLNLLKKIINKKNVKIFGVKHPLEIIKIYKEVLCFLILYKKNMDNSHKILEFFSTGYPIFSNSKFESFESKYFIALKPNHFKKNGLLNFIESQNFKKNKYFNIKRQLAFKKSYKILINAILEFSKSKKISTIKKIQVKSPI